MKITTLFAASLLVLFALVSNQTVFAAGKYRANFRYGNTLGKKIKTEISLDKPFETIQVWASHESSCKCLAEVVNEPVPSWFNFSCTLPGGYRVQATIRCDQFLGEKKAMSLFMCQNFEIWCEEK